MSIFGLAAMAASDYSGSYTGQPSADKSAASGVNLLRTQVRMLETNLAKVMLINEALWELLRAKAGLQEQDLFDKLYEIDMRDGKIDGKNQPAVRNCPKCSRPVSGRHSHCLYCGQTIDESIFRII